jgi:uncharacterized protein YcbX
MSNATLSEINIYPIKSLGGISLSETLVEVCGPRYDRRWMLADAQGRFITQREFPKMATLQLSVNENHLNVTAGDESLDIPFDTETVGNEIGVEVWGSFFTAETGYPQASQWFSDILGTNCQLVRMNQNSNRAVNPDYAVNKLKDKVSFADGYPYLLIGEGSLSDLNSKLATPVPMNRFRPNLVVSGVDPFAEDGWKKIRVGSTIFHFVKPCARCVMTTIDQQTGIPEGKEPLKTLATYRTVKKDGENKILFGQNLIAENTGDTIRVGDSVEILGE